jgi:hypothetical protein
MRLLPGGTRRRRGDALTLSVVTGALACLGPGCAPEFTGPYACVDGYASCTNPAANECETDITSDATNCGACGMVCGVGAACTASVCGTPALQLATLSQPAANQESTFAVNSTAVFWSGGQGQAGVFSVPVGGGPTATIATDMACQGAQAFAVDDDNLYYWSMGAFDSQGSTTGGLTELSLLGGTSTVLVPEGNGGIPGSCPATAVDGANVYWLGNATGVQSLNGLADVPITGGTTTTLSTVPNYDPTELVITPTSAVAVVESDNGPNSYAVVPIGGGPPAQISPSASGGSIFTADATNIYVVGSSCPCNDNGPNYSGPPMGQVVILPIAGGAVTTLANFNGQASSIALDSGNVYWSTDTAVWKVPIAGGPALPVAGNLAAAATVTGAASGYQCTGCGGSPGELTTLIAIDATSVYIADFPSSVSSVDAILRVPK